MEVGNFGQFFVMHFCPSLLCPQPHTYRDTEKDATRYLMQQGAEHSRKSHSDRDPNNVV